jgi:hypothetical protein
MEGDRSISTMQLQRRLRGLGPRQWTLQSSSDLLAHLSSNLSLAALDELSDCIIRMAEHMSSLLASVGRLSMSSLTGDGPYKLLTMLLTRASNASRQLQPTLWQQLCTAAGAALQQLGQGLQQYMQQGQLPAALTERAVEACWALCVVLSCCYSLAWKVDPGQRSSVFQDLRQVVQSSGTTASSQEDE